MRFTRLVGGLLIAILSSGCANPVVQHSFSFGLAGENEGVEITRYQYGDRAGLPTQREQTTPGRPIGQQGGVGGVFPVGRYLEVEWRDRSTGKQYAERVDLAGLRATDVEGRDLHFFIRDNVLHVVLIGQIRHPPGNLPCDVPGAHPYRCDYIHPIRYRNY